MIVAYNTRGRVVRVCACATLKIAPALSHQNSPLPFCHRGRTAVLQILVSLFDIHSTISNFTSETSGLRKKEQQVGFRVLIRESGSERQSDPVN